eukprot:189233-Pelagomonas_calceolata.AAC.5
MLHEWHAVATVWNEWHAMSQMLHEWHAVATVWNEWHAVSQMWREGHAGLYPGPCIFEGLPQPVCLVPHNVHVLPHDTVSSVSEYRRANWPSHPVWKETERRKEDEEGREHSPCVEYVWSRSTTGEL